MSKLILVFGSLRKNSKRGFNFNRFGKHEYIRTFNLKGYSMYSLGPYPTICNDPACPNDNITVELHRVSQDNFDMLNMMELGAGYKPVTIKIEEGEATIWTWDISKVQDRGLLKVYSGDWN